MCAVATPRSAATPARAGRGPIQNSPIGGVGVELARGAVGPLAEVQGHVVAVVGRLEDRARSRARRRSPSPSGGRTRSARGTGSPCRCCAWPAIPAGTTRRLPGKAAETTRAACGGERRLLARGRRGVGTLGPAGGDGVEEALRERLTTVRRRVRGLGHVVGGRLGGGGVDRVEFAFGAHAPSLARTCARRSGAQPVGLELHDERAVVAAGAVHRAQHHGARRLPVARVTARGRWAPRRGRGAALDHVPTAPLPVATAASSQRPRVAPSTPSPPMWSTVALKSPAMMTLALGALVGEPLQVIAPAAHVRGPRRDGVHRHDDRAVAVDRHGDRAGHDVGVARAVARRFDHGVVAEVGGDEDRRLPRLRAVLDLGLYCTWCTHIGRPMSRIATATLSPDRSPSRGGR